MRYSQGNRKRGAMSHSTWPSEQNCAIAQAAGVVGDWWSLLIVRDVTRGYRRFDELVSELGIARKVLTDRLHHLLTHGVLERQPYQQRPTRYEYRLTPRGQALLPVLVTLQDWGEQWLLGDGRPSATTTPRSSDAKRVRALVGTRVPVGLRLPSTSGDTLDPAESEAETTILFTYPGTGSLSPLPDNWSDIPGAAGCTLENRLFRDPLPPAVRCGLPTHRCPAATHLPRRRQRTAAPPHPRPELRPGGTRGALPRHGHSQCRRVGLDPREDQRTNDPTPITWLTDLFGQCSATVLDLCLDARIRLARVFPEDLRPHTSMVLPSYAPGRSASATLFSMDVDMWVMMIRPASSSLRCARRVW